MRYLFLPFIGVFVAVVFLIFPSSRSFGRITFKDTMSRQEQQRTGVCDLTYSQRMALECWINENFEAKSCFRERKKDPIYLTLNVDDGSKLEFSDGSIYEIIPEDRIFTSYWITPFPVEFGESGNPDYPIKIINIQTGTEVSAKEITRKELFEEPHPTFPNQPLGPESTPKAPLPPQPDHPPTGNPFSPPVNPSSSNQSEQETLKL